MVIENLEEVAEADEGSRNNACNQAEKAVAVGKRSYGMRSALRNLAKTFAPNVTNIDKEDSVSVGKETPGNDLVDSTNAKRDNRR